MMSLKELSDISSDLVISEIDDKIRIQFGDLKTNWISSDDSFIQRIFPENLNKFFIENHLKKEIEIKNFLDEGIDFLNSKKYAKSISCFDKVLYYDPEYSQALFNKSRALYAQGHFVKSLRFFKKSHVDDKDYYKLLFKKSSEERDNFPKIKRDIYAGDEAAARGEYKKAIEFYQKALANPSKFKDKILFKLLNKKASILIKLNQYDEALTSFDESIAVHENDFAFFGKGYCQHELGLECQKSLFRGIKIDKRHLLIKANIFNDINLYNDALICFNEFLDNHFLLDDDFKSAISGKIIALDALGLDSTGEKDILSQI